VLRRLGPLQRCWTGPTTVASSIRDTGRADRYVSASELAQLGYCERKIAFDARYGRRTTRVQRAAQERGLHAHASFLRESERIAANSTRKGKCFVATMVLGDCPETRDLRAFRDLVLRRSAIGRQMIGAYYRLSPALCAWLENRPVVCRAIGCFLVPIARIAGAIVRRRLVGA
jgi:hypothetical protein